MLHFFAKLYAVTEPIRNNTHQEGNRQIPPPDFAGIARRVIETRILQNNTLLSSYVNGPDVLLYQGHDPGELTFRDTNAALEESLKTFFPPKEVIHFILRQIQEPLTYDVRREVRISIAKIKNVYSYKTGDPIPDWETDAMKARTYNRQREGFSVQIRDFATLVIRENPELMVAICFYEALSRIFFMNVLEEVMKQAPEIKVDIDSLDIKSILSQLTGNTNFLKSIVPAIIVMANEAGELGDVDLSTRAENTEVVFSRETITKAVEYVKKAGFFRNNVLVTADVASDGRERVQKFQCPMSEVVTTVMLQALGILYDYVRTSDEFGLDTMQIAVRDVLTGTDT
jgi:hypothetical protein